jgi:hypothetical protein
MIYTELVSLLKSLALSQLPSLSLITIPIISLQFQCIDSVHLLADILVFIANIHNSFLIIPPISSDI